MIETKDQQKSQINEVQETGCCPRFDPDRWDQKEFNWDDKYFVKDHVRGFFHIPINFGKVIARNVKKIEDDGHEVLDNLVLSDESSLLGSDLYFCVSNPIPNSNNVKLKGLYMSKVFEGEYKDSFKWVDVMKEYVKSQGKKASRIFHWYTTCPDCAKVYGENNIVLFAQIDE